MSTPHSETQTQDIARLNRDSAVLARFPAAVSGAGARDEVGQDVADDAAPLGQFFKIARERSGVTLEQVANETRIPARHLEALEQGHLDAIPNGIYLRAEIRAYAEWLHLDPRMALGRFAPFMVPVSYQVAVPQQPRAIRVSRKAVMTTGLLASAVIIAVALDGVSSAPQEAGAGTVVEAAPQSAAAPTTPAVIASAEGESVPDAVTLGAQEPSPAQDSSPIGEATEGQLTVTTDPPGGRVTVDGIGWGVSPVTVRHLPLGAKRVRVSKDGYGVVERVVRLAPDQATRQVVIRLPSAE